MSKRRYLVPLITVAVAALLAAAAYADLKPGTKAPNFTLPTIDGKTFTLSDCFGKTGKVVLLDIWATWCPPCKAEVPHLVQLTKKYKSKGLKVVGVAIDEQKSTVASFAKQQHINYTVALDPNAQKVGKSYQVRGIPATYVIDSKGVIRFVHSGFPRDKAEASKAAAKIESEVKKLLAQK